MTITQRIDKIQTFHLFICFAFLCALIYSKAGITLCYLAWGLMAVYRYTQVGHHAIERSWLFIFLLIGVLLSGWNSEHLSAWYEQIRIYTAFALLPYIFLFIPKLPENFIIVLHTWFLFILLVTSAILCLDVMTGDMSAILDQISRGGSIYTPMEHVKFSVFCSYAVVSNAWIVMKYRQLQLRRVLIIGIVLLFGLMHFMAVRTGLVISYSLIVAIILRYGWIHRRWTVALFVLFFGALLAFCSIRHIPSLHAKWGYTLYDWQHGQESYSDSGRWINNRRALMIWLDNPWFGVGGGDVLETMRSYALNTSQAKIDDRLPHNQFILVLVRSGLVGLLFFMVGWLGPLIFIKRRIALVWILYGCIGLSFMVENSFERSISVGFFLFFFLLIQSASRAETSEHQNEVKSLHGLFVDF